MDLIYLVILGYKAIHEKLDIILAKVSNIESKLLKVTEGGTRRPYTPPLVDTPPPTKRVMYMHDGCCISKKVYCMSKIMKVIN
jgi:hypothetical protein